VARRPASRKRVRDTFFDEPQPPLGYDRIVGKLALVAVVALAALAAGPVRAAEPGPTVEEATALLSRFPAGDVPVDPTVMDAIHTLGEIGDHTSVSLLRSLVEHERDEIASAARRAIARIRDAQRTSQRASFAASLDDIALEPVARPLRGEGLGLESSRCLAYAKAVLGPPRGAFVAPATDEADPLLLLADGMPRKALAVVIDDAGPDAGMLQARALEELGDLPGALRVYAALAAGGHADARAALEAYGIDAERLLLGVWMEREPTLGTPGEPIGGERLLDTLVRHGGDLTVSVLAEQGRSGAPVEQAQAADALGRMLDDSVRAVPLAPSDRSAARVALQSVVATAVAPVRAIALEALSQ
jgi:hypothetical protein